MKEYWCPSGIRIIVLCVNNYFIIILNIWFSKQKSTQSALQARNQNRMPWSSSLLPTSYTNYAILAPLTAPISSKYSTNCVTMVLILICILEKSLLHISNKSEFIKFSSIRFTHYMWTIKTCASVMQSHIGAVFWINNKSTEWFILLPMLWWHTVSFIRWYTADWLSQGIPSTA